MKKDGKESSVRYIFIALGVFILAFAVALIMSILLHFVHFPDTQAGIVADMIGGVIAAVAAGLVLFELRESEKERARQNDIEEASFLLQYNQSFIQDSNMTEVESLLERQTFYNYDQEIITEENRQQFVNYLVYLEGLAPLVFRGVFNLDHIDNLMSYRFFLAVNNKEVQDKELKKFANEYRGCYKLYKEWVDYRDRSNLEILGEETALDKWNQFKFYAGDEFYARQIKNKQSLSPDQKREIAELIFDTDSFIYPALFAGNRDPKENARQLIPHLLEKETDTMFCKDNLFACYYKDQIIGLILWVRGELFWDYKQFVQEAVSIGINLSPKNVEAVSNAYIGNRYTSVKENEETKISLINVCVNESFRGKGIGSFLMDSFIRQHSEEAMELCVLKENDSAVQLYLRKNFAITNESPGFSLEEEKPVCYEMHRKATNN